MISPDPACVCDNIEIMKYDYNVISGSWTLSLFWELSSIIQQLSCSPLSLLCLETWPSWARGVSPWYNQQFANIFYVIENNASAEVISAGDVFRLVEVAIKHVKRVSEV